jgi:predicted ATPase/DNA-binding SARP family transcriptional activator
VTPRNLARVGSGEGGVEVRLLGHVEVRRGPETLPVEGTRRKTLLAVLALNHGKVVSADRLIHLLWGDDVSTGTAHNLRAHVSNLRKVLGADAPKLVSRPPGYLFDIDGDAIDVVRFERLAAAGRAASRQHDLERGLAQLRAALALWRGPPLADLAGVEVAEREADRLAQERLGVIEDRIDAELALGHHGDVVAELEALASEHPVRERLAAQLMLALYRCGRQADALRAYEQTRVFLARELGIEPARELRDLEAAIAAQDPALDFSRAGDPLLQPPSSAGAGARRETLPPEVGELLGRDDLVAELVALLDAAPLVTLWGPGGVGKTRLAVRVARARDERFRDGVCFVDLTTCGDGASVGDVLLTSLGAQRRVDETVLEAVVRVLRSLEALIVLDNCEHVIEEAREVAQGVLSACRDIHLLVTSRERLAVASERAVNVPPLEVPSNGAAIADIEAESAVRLFVDRAQRVDDGFALGAHNVESVVTLLKTLDGLPLAIELAAGHLDVESVDDLAGAGAERLVARLQARVATAGRSASLDASIAWSYDALSDDEQALFRAASTFAGPFTREMALTVSDRTDTEAGAAFDRLIRVSLVGRDLSVPARFRLLEPVKAFGRLQQDADERLSRRRRHAATMLALAERFGPMVRTSEQRQACAVFRADLADHRAAMALLVNGEAGDVDAAARLLVALFSFCHFHVVPEVNRWAAELSSILPADHDLRADVCGAAALGAWFEGAMERAIELGEDAVACAAGHGRSAPPWARLALVDAYGFLGQVNSVYDHFVALVRDSRADPNPFWQINGLGYEALGALTLGRVQSARQSAEHALTQAGALGNPECLQWALHCLGRVLVGDDPAAAIDAFEEAMAVAERVDSRLARALNLSEWVGVKRQLGAREDAAAGLVELFGLLRLMGMRSLLAVALREAAYLLHAFGDDEAATAALLARKDLPAMPVLQDDTGELLRDLRVAAGDRWSRLELRARIAHEPEVVAQCVSALALHT